MKTGNSTFSFVPAICIAAILAGCGGGGGGGNQGGNVVNPPVDDPSGVPDRPTISYTGNRDPIIVSKDNATELAARVMSAAFLPIPFEKAWIYFADIGTPGPVDRIVEGYDGGEATVTGTFETAADGYLDVQFVDYTDSGVILNGRYVQKHSGVSGDSNYYAGGHRGSMDFHDLSVEYHGTRFVLRGTAEIVSDDGSQLLLNMLVDWPATGEQIYLQDVAISISRWHLDISGTVFSPSDGSVEVNALQSFETVRFDAASDTTIASAGGSFSITAEGPALEFRSISRQYVAVMLDTDLDGMSDEAFRLSWRELAGKDIPVYVPTSGPIANAGAPLAGSMDEEAVVHGLFSHDADGDWLSFEWRLIARPPGSQLSELSSASPIIAFRPDAPGEYVLTVRVNDGINSSESSTVLYVDTAEKHHPQFGVHTGNLEVAMPADVGVPILIDGRSASNNHYDAAVPEFEVDAPRSLWLTVSDKPEIVEIVSDGVGMHLITMFEGAFDVLEYNYSEVPISIGQPSFEVDIMYTDPSEGYAREVLLHDIDQDGNMDIGMSVSVGEETGGFQWLAGDGNGGFESRPLTLLPDGSGTGGTDIGDLNNDGLPDVAIAGPTGVYTAMQNDDGTMSAFTLHAQNDPVCSKAKVSQTRIDDIDGDGSNEVIVYRGCDESVYVWRQDQGTLTGGSRIDIADRIIRFYSSDFDSDGRADLLLSLIPRDSQADGNNIVILYGQDDGSFEASSVFFFPDRGFRAPVVGDFNGNGRADFLLIDSGTAGVYEPQTDRTIVPLEPLVGDFIWATRDYPVVGDIDSDGDIDLVSCASNNLYIAYRLADGSYKTSTAGRCPYDHWLNSIAVMDFNNDGHSDVILGGAHGRSSARIPQHLIRVFLGNVSMYSRPAN